jgi:cytochrome b subunit of formate dehydrogenase
MLRTIAITGLAATVAGVLLHFVTSMPKFDAVFGKDRSMKILDPVRFLVFLMTLLFVEQKWSVVGALRKLVFLVALFCLAVLAVTGFVPRVIYNEAISGWWLFIHAIMAGVFAASMAALAVLWADKNRFDKNYLPWINDLLQRQPKSTVTPDKYELEIKICFWGIFVLMLPVILSAIVSMFKIFGTYGQGVLLQIHGYSTLFLLILSIIYLYFAALNEMEKTAGRS